MAGALTLPSGLEGRVERASAALPALRQDLQLLPGPANSDGVPSWTIHDPARHRFVRIGWAEFEFLSRWDLADAAAIARSVNAQTTIHATARDVDMLASASRCPVEVTSSAPNSQISRAIPMQAYHRGELPVRTRARASIGMSV